MIFERKRKRERGLEEEVEQEKKFPRESPPHRSFCHKRKKKQVAPVRELYFAFALPRTPFRTNPTSSDDAHARI